MTDISGWTHVVKGIKGNKPHVNPMELKPTEIPNGMTIPKLLDRFYQCQEAWTASDCWVKLKRIVENRILPAKGVQITRCVCLGLGSLSGVGRRETSLYQLAALLSVLDILGMWHRRNPSQPRERNLIENRKDRSTAVSVHPRSHVQPGR